MWLLSRGRAAGVAVPPPEADRYAELRDAERYRDSLTPGSAEWEGAAAVVTRARRMYEAG
jgi:hypothetical protein